MHLVAVGALLGGPLLVGALLVVGLLPLLGRLLLVAVLRRRLVPILRRGRPMVLRRVLLLLLWWRLVLHSRVQSSSPRGMLQRDDAAGHLARGVYPTCTASYLKYKSASRPTLTKKCASHPHPLY